MRAVSFFGTTLTDHGERLRELEVSLSGSREKSGEAFTQSFAAWLFRVNRTRGLQAP
jgi:hypothetical protein